MNTDGKLKLSVVVPIYKVEKFVGQTLSSLAAQTLKDIEFILVDDGSPDSCGKIIDDWALKDQRFKAIHQKNSGYGAAVNRGMQVAQGKYVAILESDDWVEPAMYERLYESAEQAGVEVARCAFYVYDSKNQRKPDTVWPETKKLVEKMPDGVFNPMDYPFIFDCHSALWAYIYRRDFLEKNNIHIDSENRGYQDLPFIFDVLSSVTRMVMVKEYMHHYRMELGQGSSSTTVSPRSMDMVYASKLTREILKKKGKLSSLLSIFYRHCIVANRYFYERTPDNLKPEYRLEMNDFFAPFDLQLSDGLAEVDIQWYRMIKSQTANWSVASFDSTDSDWYDTKAVQVVYTCDDNYASYLSVSLLTLAKYSDKSRNYVIHIVCENFSSITIGLYRATVAAYKNIHLNFIEASTQYEKAKEFFVDRHLSSAAYVRFFFPEIFANLDKILYLDIDTVVCDDVSKVFDLDLKDNFAAGCVDQAVSVCEFGDFGRSHEILTKLGYKDFSKYVNSGVMLFNLNLMRIEGKTSELCVLATENQFIFHDQDALNLAFKGRILHIDERWNFTTHNCPWLYSVNVQSRMQKYIQSWNIGIIHYPGAEKPWNSSQGLLPSIWQIESRSSPFFSEFLRKNDCRADIGDRKDRLTSISGKLKYARYTLMSNIFGGKRKQHYLDKINKMKG